MYESIQVTNLTAYVSSQFDIFILIRMNLKEILIF